MRKSRLKLLKHPHLSWVCGISTPIATMGWTDTGAKKPIREGRIYLVVSEDYIADSKEFSFLVVPGGSIPWVQMEEDWFTVHDILTRAKKEFSCNEEVPKVTYFSGYSGPSESDQVNFLKLEFWNRIRNFVGMALKSLEQES